MTTIHEIQEAVAEHYNLSVEALTANTRTYRVITPRHIAYWLSRRITKKSYLVIARQFNRRDHSTVAHGVKTVDGWIMDGREMGLTAVELERSLTQ